MANMEFLELENSILTFKISIENVLYLYPVYSGCIVGVICGDSNSVATELCFMANMGFSWVDSFL